MFHTRPFASAFPPPVYPPVGDCFAFWDSSVPGLELFCMFIALCRHLAGGHSCTLPHSRNMIEARPYAQDDLCCSVRHHFRAAPTSLTPVTPLLPVSPNLNGAYRQRRLAETPGSQVRFTDLFRRMPLTLPRVPDRCACPPDKPCRDHRFASRSAMAFPSNVEGRRVARTTRFIPQPASPSYSRPV